MAQTTKGLFLICLFLVSANDVFCQLFDDIKGDSTRATKKEESTELWIFAIGIANSSARLGSLDWHSKLKSYQTANYTGVPTETSSIGTTIGSQAYGYSLDASAQRSFGKFGAGIGVSRQIFSGSLLIRGTDFIMGIPNKVSILSMYLCGSFTTKISGRIYLLVNARLGYPLYVNTSFEKDIAPKNMSGCEFGLLGRVGNRCNVSLTIGVINTHYRYNSFDYRIEPHASSDSWNNTSRIHEYDVSMNRGRTQWNSVIETKGTVFFTINKK